jgi:hypothetical protein
MIIEELEDGDEGATTTARGRRVESEGVNSTEINLKKRSEGATA